MDRRRYLRRLNAVAPPGSVRELSDEQLLQIVNCSGNDPYTYSLLERQAWREIMLRELAAVETRRRPGRRRDASGWHA